MSLVSKEDVKDIKTIQWARRAYVWLVMRGDAYVSGALVSMQSVKNTKTKAKCVVMVTDDVSERGRERLATLADKVVPVKYLQYKCRTLPTPYQQDRYGSWIHQSFTKWRCLELKGFDKVLFLDADIIALENLDPLFELRAPAASFSNPWAQPWKPNGLINPYLHYKHGQIIPRHVVKFGLENCFTLMGSTILLVPCKEWFDQLMQWLDSVSRRFRPGIGFPRCHNGQDEQSLAAALMNKGWTQIHQRYNSYFWHNKWLDGQKPATWHYIGEKPWKMKTSQYHDLDGWWGFLESLPPELFEPELLAQRDQRYEDCPICGKGSTHRVITHGTVTCPQLNGYLEQKQEEAS